MVVFSTEPSRLATWSLLTLPRTNPEPIDPIGAQIDGVSRRAGRKASFCRSFDLSDRPSDCSLASLTACVPACLHACLPPCDGSWSCLITVALLPSSQLSQLKPSMLCANPLQLEHGPWTYEQSETEMSLSHRRRDIVGQYSGLATQTRDLLWNNTRSHTNEPGKKRTTKLSNKQANKQTNK